MRAARVGARSEQRRRQRGNVAGANARQGVCGDGEREGGAGAGGDVMGQAGDSMRGSEGGAAGGTSDACEGTERERRTGGGGSGSGAGGVRDGMRGTQASGDDVCGGDGEGQAHGTQKHLQQGGRAEGQDGGDESGRHGGGSTGGDGHDLMRQHAGVGGEHTCTTRACTAQEQMRGQGESAGRAAGKARMQCDDMGALGAYATARAGHERETWATAAGAAHRMSDEGCSPEHPANLASASRDFSRATAPMPSPAIGSAPCRPPSPPLPQPPVTSSSPCSSPTSLSVDSPPPHTSPTSPHASVTSRPSAAQPPCSKPRSLSASAASVLGVIAAMPPHAIVLPSSLCGRVSKPSPPYT